MKIAILTKPSVASAPEIKGITAAIKGEKDFYVHEFTNASLIGTGYDRILAFGGDGTMLDAAVKAAEIGAHVLGINLGNMGFLTEFERSVATERVVGALKSGMFIEKILLEVTAGGVTQRALNDAVIKSACTRPIRMSLFVDGYFVDCYHSDGLILSTPSGSTAYALSAGGPVVAPEVDAFIVIPICAHSLHSRPLVISSHSKIEIKTEDADCATVIVDGEIIKPEGGFAMLTAQKSALKAKFIDAGGDGFFKKLLVKMNRWGITDF